MLAKASSEIYQIRPLKLEVTVRVVVANSKGSRADRALADYCFHRQTQDLMARPCAIWPTWQKKIHGRAAHAVRGIAIENPDRRCWSDLDCLELPACNAGIRWRHRSHKSCSRRRLLHPEYSERVLALVANWILRVAWRSLVLERKGNIRKESSLRRIGPSIFSWSPWSKRRPLPSKQPDLRTMDVK